MRQNPLLFTVLVTLALASVRAIAANTWQQSFGGTNADVVQALTLTPDGGCIIGGYSYSDTSPTKSAPQFGGGDFWIVKLNAAGARQWDVSFGGEQFDGITALQQTSDGGAIAGGVTFSTPGGNKSSAHFGDADFWIVKLDAAGGKQWERSLGGASNDVLTTVQQTRDGGFIIGGNSLSSTSGNKTAANLGGSDYWVTKLDASGNGQWQRAFGGTADDELQHAQQTPDGGFLLAGHSASGVNGNKSSANFGAGTTDFWILKLDANGNRQWERAYGGTGAEELRGMHVFADGSVLLAGTTSSPVSGNKTSTSHGSHDFWIVRLDASGNKVWERAYGGSDSDELHNLRPTAGGGFVLGGFSVWTPSGNKSVANLTNSGREYWLLKVDASGGKEWEQSLAANVSDTAPALCSVPDGFLVMGLLNGPSPDLDFSALKIHTPPRLLSVSRGGGQVQVQSSGVSGTSYTLHSSTNLSTWTSVQTRSAGTNGLVNFSVSDTQSAKRFFRVSDQ